MAVACGDKLGDIAEEVGHVHIGEFVSGGPKN